MSRLLGTVKNAAISFLFQSPGLTTTLGGNLTTGSTGTMVYYIVNKVSMKQFKEMMAVQKNFQIIALILVELV